METERYYQGNDINLVRQVQVDDVTLDLTSYQMKLGISVNLEDLSGSKTPTYITGDFPINSVLTNSTTRTMTIPASVSNGIPTGQYFYEVQLISPAGKITTIELGNFILDNRIIE
jgi:hypothetical protein